MSNFVTANIQIESKLTSMESEFFHLDAEFFHPSLASAQVLSFNEDTMECRVELFFDEMTPEDFCFMIFQKPMSVSVDNMEMKYNIIQVE